MAHAYRLQARHNIGIMYNIGVPRSHHMLDNICDATKRKVESLQNVLLTSILPFKDSVSFFQLFKKQKHAVCSNFEMYLQTLTVLINIKWIMYLLVENIVNTVRHPTEYSSSKHVVSTLFQLCVNLVLYHKFQKIFQFVVSSY